jgi:hypothetical protein
MLLKFFGTCAEERSVAQQRGGLWYCKDVENFLLPRFNIALPAQEAGATLQLAAAMFPEGWPPHNTLYPLQLLQYPQLPARFQGLMILNRAPIWCKKNVPSAYALGTQNATD